jgi:hypothetical protein
MYCYIYEKGKIKTIHMDLSIIQKVSELSSEGRSADDIRQELKTGGVAPESIELALKEAGVALTQTPAQSSSTSGPAVMHHEKVIQPSSGFDPNSK